MPFLSAIAGCLPRASVARLALVSAAVVAGVLSLGACGERRGEEKVPEHRADAPAEVAGTDAVVESGPAVDTGGLAPLLEQARAAGRLSDTDRQILEQAMQAVLAPVASACEGCRTTVAYIDEAGGGDHFRCDLLGASGEPIADLEFYHRPDLPADAADGWARSKVAGHPASELAGEHLFVWPGRFEIRAFGRAESLRGRQALEKLVAGLPLDALAKL